MRLIKTFTLAALAVVAAMAFAGATPASAVSTQLCDNHNGLSCQIGHAVTTVHAVLPAGEVGELLASLPVLCLGYLVQASVGALSSGATRQTITSVTQTFTGCGTGSAHDNCIATIPTGQQPVYALLKTGLDAGTLTGISGQTRLECPFFIDCLFDIGGMAFSVGGGHLTATEAPTTELGGKFVCPNNGLLDALLETLNTTYVLG